MRYEAQLLQALQDFPTQVQSSRRLLHRQPTIEDQHGACGK
jgi:hypothetical protein